MAPKHKDLGKSVNDHFSKGFPCGKVAVEVKQNVSSDLFNGPITLNFGLNKANGKCVSDGKSEMTIGRNFFVPYVVGVKYTEAFSPDSCDYTQSFEKSMGCAKFNYSSTLNLNDKLTKDVSCSVEGSGAKWNSTLKFLQEDAFSMPNSVIGNLVFSPVGKHNFGGAVNYNIATKAVHHTVSLEANHPTGSVMVTLKDAKTAELGVQQAVNRSVPVLGIASYDIKNCYVKANCQLDANPDVKADIGFDCVAKVGGFQTKLSKMKYNIASQVMTCSHKFKVNDSCDANVATSLHLPTFGDMKIGAQLHFGV